MTIFKTFKDFLHTGSSEDLLARCESFLEQSGGLPLYRGYKKSIAGRFGRATEVTVRKDRKPRDTKLLVHNLMDEYLKEKFGTKVRSEALFTTGDMQTTLAYGKPHYVFPVGEFKFVWVELDGYPVVDTLKISREIKDAVPKHHSSDLPAVTREIMDKYTWRTDNLKLAIKKGIEIAIICDKVILIPAGEGEDDYQKIIGR